LGRTAVPQLTLKRGSVWSQALLHGDENMPSPEIEGFARIPVENVDGASIKTCDRRFQANATSPAAKRWKEMARSATREESTKVQILDIVDDAISSVLSAVGDGLLKISFSASSGKVSDLNSEGIGELAGW
jgi:hypothetical protein